MDIVKQVQAMSYVADEAANEIEWLRGELRTAADEIERLREALQAVVDAHGTGAGIGAQGAGSWLDQAIVALKEKE